MVHRRYIPIKEGEGEGCGCGFARPYFKNVSFFSNLNLSNNLRKTEGGVMGNLRLYLRKTRGGREGVWRRFSEGKTKRT